MTLILVLVLFGFMIFIHELGHFTAAKLCKVKVEQFTIGFGPAILKKRIKGTLYALRLLPIGGAVMMKGESDEEKLLAGKDDTHEDENCGLSYYEASPLKRVFICLSGPFMNFLSALLVLIILFMPVSLVYSPKITSFMDGFEYRGEDGFIEGDRIVSVNGFHIYVYGDLLTALSLGEGEPYDIKLDRNGKTVKLYDFPLEKKISDEGSLKYGFIFGTESLNLTGRISYAFKNAASFIQSAYKSFGLIFSGKAKASDVMGTVGIASEMSKRAKSSSEELWYFIAFISANLAVVNLLPIPGLDGGKIIFSLVEIVIGKKLDPKYENYFSYAGLILVLGLFVFVTYHDIMRLIS